MLSMGFAEACSPRMLKPAIRNTSINSQKTIVPMMAGTLRWMPMRCIESARPLWSAAICRPSFSDKVVTALADEAGDHVADHDHHDHGHDLRRDGERVCARRLKAFANGVPGVA